jgi:hypothetical protein
VNLPILIEPTSWSSYANLMIAFDASAAGN